MSWLPELAPGSDAFERAFGLRPNLAAAWREFEALLWTTEGVAPRVLALCRLRLLDLHGARVVPGSAGPPIDDATRRALGDWRRSDRFSDFEKACLGFAEQYAMDPGLIPDAEAARVIEPLGPAGAIAFVEALALFDGIARFAAMLGLDDAAGDAVETPA